MPTTFSSARAVLPPALVVLAAACVLLAGALALAGPAAALEDPRRPTAEVTHGPSCGPGVIRVVVTNGTQPHRVALVFDGAGEQDSATLAAGGQAELVSEDVDWGRTVDVSISVTGADGTAQEPPLELSTYTRPSAEDCAAVSTPDTGPGEGSVEPAPWTAATTVAPSGSAAVPESPTHQPTPRTPGPSTAPSVVPGTPTAGDGEGAERSGRAGSGSAASVSPGGIVTVRATGFAPGEPVIVSIVGLDDPLATVEAAGDGSVEAVVQIPRGASVGTTTVQLVGGVSAATAGLDLLVAARIQPVSQQSSSLPGLAAAAALAGAAGMLGSMAARRSRGHHSWVRH